MTRYGCTYLLTTSQSHKINTAKLGNKNVIFKQEKYSQGQKNIKNAPLHGQL